MIVRSKSILAIASWFNGWEVEAITLWPFIFASDTNPVALQHERIHLAQITELFVVGFYFLYIMYYLKAALIDRDSAYALNPFEIEAYKYEREPGYLFYREPFAWR